MLSNPGFEAASSRHVVIRYSPDLPDGAEIPRGNVTCPLDWGCWEWHQKPSPNWDPHTFGFVSPEQNPIVKVPPFLDPPRIHSGQGAFKQHSFFSRHRSGLYQVVDSLPGQRLRASFWAHAWSQSSTDAEKTHDNPGFSSGVGTGPFYSLLSDLDATDPDYEGKRNMSFKVGIDPTGGTNPLSDTVVWGQEVCIYNAYAEVPAVEVVAEGDHATVFTYVTTVWRFKHCDDYIDTASLEVVADLPVEDPPSGMLTAPDGALLSLHAIASPGAWDILTNLMARDEPYALPYCKILCTSPNDLPSLTELQEISPDTQFIVRLMEIPGSGVNIEGPDFSSDPVDYMAVLLPYMRKYPGVIWELWNEQNPPGVHLRVARFAIGCMKIAAAEGIRIAVMSYSSGVPTGDVWDALITQTQFFQTMQEGGHILSLHCYCETNNIESIKYHLRRYESLYAKLVPLGLAVPFFYTEYSVSGGITMWDTDALISEYRRVSAIMGGWWYCLGAALYTFGMTASSWAWYSHNEIWKPIADMLYDLRGRVNAQPPGLGVPPGPGEPPDDCPLVRNDFRHILSALIPPGYGYKWHAALEEEWEEHRFNISASADHSFVRIKGDAPVRRTVLALNPDEWPGDLVKFYEKWYPHSQQYPLTYVPIYADTPQEWAAGVHARYNPGELKVIDVRGSLPVNKNSPWYPWKKRADDEIKIAFVHHSAGANSSSFSTVLNIAQYHTSGIGKNRPSICYAYVIGTDGTIWKTGDINNVVFGQGSEKHPGDENRYGLSICLLGSFVSGSEPSPAQLVALHALIAYTERRLGRTIKVWGHSDVARTQCPGDSWPFSPGWGKKDEPDIPPSPFRSMRGVHSAPKPFPTIGLGALYERLGNLDMALYKVLDDGNPSNNALYKGLLHEGITPVVRAYVQGQGNHRLPDPLMVRMKAVANMGVRYLELGFNEINLSHEWEDGYPSTGWRDTAAVNTGAENWFTCAREIIEHSPTTIVGTPVMAPTDNRGNINRFYSSVMWMKGKVDYLFANRRADMIDWLREGRIFLNVHATRMNRPFEFDPYQFGAVDDMCFRGHEWLQDYFVELFGYFPLTISTESGVFSPDHMRQLGWEPDYDEAGWGRTVLEMDDFMKRYRRIHGICSWCFTDEGSDWKGSGWYTSEGAPRSPVSERP